jgi:DNA-binding MarR family transcriptional regulator
MGMSRSLASLVVDQLVRRGLVTRTEDSQDRRYVALRVTPQGDAMIKRLYPGCWIGLDTYLAELETADLLALHRALQALHATRDP